jgi:hypothetical protein
MRLINFLITSIVLFAIIYYIIGEKPQNNKIDFKEYMKFIDSPKFFKHKWFC